MFKKLKDKIAEEVKQSPLKTVQQLAQAVVSPNSSSVFEPSSSNDKFCIEEGDIEEEAASVPGNSGGFISVALTGQTSSPLRDPKLGFRPAPSLHTVHEAENFFPVFEPQPTNFHVQSEVESASEVEDRYSQLEHINKESLYEAYRKVYNRYNRMKNKYHELVTHYRQLDREKERAKTVLTETQDKALLRISELREQCVLEQQAKAHLEEALRNELEERDHIINSLKTKVQYLKTVNESGATEGSDSVDLSTVEDENLIDFTDSSQVTKVPSPSVASSDTDWPEEQIKKCKEFFNERSARITALKTQLEHLKKSNINWNELQKATKTDNELVLSNENANNDSNIPHSLEQLLNELTEEVKTVQDLTDAYIQQKPYSSKVRSGSEETQDSGTNRIGSESGDKTNNNVDVDLNKLVSQYKEENNKYQALYKELEKQNQDLTKQLQDYANTKELINKKYEDLNNTCTNLKFYLQTINKDCSTESLPSDVEDKISSFNDDLSQGLLECVQHLRGSKRELKSLKTQYEKLEKEHKDITDKLKLVQSEKEKNCNEVNAENKTLSDQLERLRKENNLLSNQQESLKIEVSDLKKEKKEVENKVKGLADLVKRNEEESKSKQEALKLVNLNFIEEKNVLQSEITTLQSNLSKVDQTYSGLQQENQELNEKLLSLKQERETLLADKIHLQSKIEELKMDIDKTKHEHSELQTTANEISLKQQESLNKQNNDLSNKLNDVEQDLERSKSDLLIVSEVKDKLSEELKSLSKELENILAEKLNLQSKVNHLEKELEISKQDYLSSSETLKQVTHSLNTLTKEHQELTAENNNAKKRIEECSQDITPVIEEIFQRSFNSLERRKDEICNEQNGLLRTIYKLAHEKETEKELMMTEMQSKNELLTQLKLEKDSLLSQIENLKKDICSGESNVLLARKREEELDLVNVSLTETIKRLKEELERRNQEFNSTMNEMIKTYEEISLEKGDLEKNIEEQTLLSKSKVEEVMSLKCTNEQLAQELTLLKSKKEQDNHEISSFKLNHEKLLGEFEEFKQNHSLVLEAKDKINDELTSLKREYKNTLTVLDGMQSELQNQQQLCSELNESLNDLSESFQLKSNEIEKKSQENSQLKGDLQSITTKYNQSHDLLQKLTSEKHIIVERLLQKLNDIKYLKKVQQNLTEFVGQFKKEIFEELALIRIKTEKELFYQTRNMMQEKEASTRHLLDVEIKTKEEINAFNSKLQNLESELKEANENLRDKLCRQCELEKDKFSKMSADLLSEDQDTEYSQFVCRNLLTKLSEAVKLLRFMKENCESKLSVQQVNGITHLGLNEEVDLELKESWSSEKMFSEIDLFLNKFDKLNLDASVHNLTSKIESIEYLQDNIPLEPSCDKVLISRVDASNKDLNLEVEQLLQELKLKNEIINELQKTIGEYKQETQSSQLKNHRSSSLLSLQSEESVSEQTTGDESKTEKWVILEQENQALMQKVLDQQETYELQIQSLVTDYENKLEERTLFDLEVTSGEKKNAISEMKEQIQNLQQDLDDRGDAFEKLYEEHQQTLKQREEESRQQRVNYEKEMREQDKKWRSCLDRRVAEEELRHQAEVEELTSEWTKQRKELETASRLAVSVVESGTSSSELLRRQVQALTMQVNALESNRCEMCETKRAFARERRKSNGSSRSIQDCTEMEYLRNILYEYMMGKEPLVLAKVLCALVKFDDTQTNDIVVKEQQKITLLGQLGLQ